MSNKKKLRGTRDGATRITPDKSTKGLFFGLYKLEAYDKKADEWNTLEGCSNLTWGQAVIASTNYTALRRGCKIANNTVIRIIRPGIDEGERDE
ncbi:hypothetical protein BC669P1_00033 [Bacteroides phage BC669P1]|nr:hypothetical protein BC669P1_00033 [Bacteroides phage BC669P1]WAX05671.1 hypothetical protein BC669P2_00009 [Bacteroides phage BC669P2]